MPSKSKQTNLPRDGDVVPVVVGVVGGEVVRVVVWLDVTVVVGEVVGVDRWHVPNVPVPSIPHQQQDGMYHDAANNVTRVSGVLIAR